MWKRQEVQEMLHGKVMQRGRKPWATRWFGTLIRVGNPMGQESALGSTPPANYQLEEILDELPGFDRVRKPNYIPKGFDFHWSGSQ
jgi:hypothetical protein